MMKLDIPFGMGTQSVEIPDGRLLGILEPNRVEIKSRGLRALAAALEKPEGTPRLWEIVKPGEKTVIITGDITRPVPSRLILPTVLAELRRGGQKPEEISLVFGLGIHRKQTEAERRSLAGEEIYGSLRCADSDPADCVRMGVTSGGTPVDITRIVAEADRRIGIGSIEYHYFAGYSGGAKALMPGVSSRAAIAANHSRMVQPGAAPGVLEGNPVREDIEEALRFCPLDFIVNVVLDEHKDIVYAVAGHPVAAHRSGCRFLDAMYRKEIPAPADIVIASPGGAPKDLNLYQTQKALDNAKHAVKPGGVIILAGSCGEGLGEAEFEDWMLHSPSPEAMVERIKRDFRLGGHKAAAIALVLRNTEIYLVSEMAPDFVRGIFLTPFPTVQAAFDAAMEKKGGGADVLVMPYAGSTLPVVNGKTRR